MLTNILNSKFKFKKINYLKISNALIFILILINFVHYYFEFQSYNNSNLGLNTQNNLSFVFNSLQFFKLFIPILISPILEEFVFRYSITPNYKNSNLKLLSLIGFIFIIFIDFTKQLNSYEYINFVSYLLDLVGIKLYSNYYFYKYFIDYLIPMFIFLILAIIYKFLNIKILNIINNIKQFITDNQLLLTVLSITIFITIHYNYLELFNFNLSNILYFTTLLLGSIILIIHTNYISIKSAILIHSIYNTIQSILELSFNNEPNKIIYYGLLILWLLIVSKLEINEIQKKNDYLKINF